MLGGWWSLSKCLNVNIFSVKVTSKLDVSFNSNSLLLHSILTFTLKTYDLSGTILSMSTYFISLALFGRIQLKIIV